MDPSNFCSLLQVFGESSVITIAAIPFDQNYPKAQPRIVSK